MSNAMTSIFPVRRVPIEQRIVNRERLQRLEADKNRNRIFVGENPDQARLSPRELSISLQALLGPSCRAARLNAKLDRMVVSTEMRDRETPSERFESLLLVALAPASSTVRE